MWVIGEAVFWWSPNAAFYGGIGGAQHIREVGSATLLRLVAPPEVSAAHRLIAGAVSYTHLVLVKHSLHRLLHQN